MRRLRSQQKTTELNFYLCAPWLLFYQHQQHTMKLRWRKKYINKKNLQDFKRNECHYINKFKSLEKQSALQCYFDLCTPHSYMACKYLDKNNVNNKNVFYLKYERYYCCSCSVCVCTHRRKIVSVSQHKALARFEMQMHQMIYGSVLCLAEKIRWRIRQTKSAFCQDLEWPFDTHIQILF